MMGNERIEVEIDRREEKRREKIKWVEIDIRSGRG